SKVWVVYHRPLGMDNGSSENPAESRPAPRPGRSGSGEGAFERRRQIADQVRAVLDADRVSDQVVLDPDLEPLLTRQLVEAHDRRLLDERLDPAQRGGDVGNGAGVDHPRRRVEIPRHLEGDHAAEAAHLLPGYG